MCDWLAKAVYPCAENGDDFAGFGCGEGGVPLVDSGYLVDPYRKGRSIVFRLEEPFVREAGGGALGGFWSGAGELWWAIRNA
jgi:hypothetical protein